MASSTVENYVKQLYLEQQQVPGELVPMGKLAAAMGVVPGTATAMIKTLSDAGLVEYEPRLGVRLTRGGEQLALHVLRRHRLVELLLVEVLKLDWSEVHEEAEQLEHVISNRVLERIDALLHHPSVDPHGDPIPTAQGKMREQSLVRLVDCPAGSEVVVARVLDQDPAFLQFAERNRLMPGAGLTVDERNTTADSMRVRTPEGHSISLGMSAAGGILVRPPDRTASAGRPHS